MSDDTVDSVPVETKARQLGWLPKEEFKGNPERWTDAASFVEKGEQILPILHKNNERLHSALSQRDSTIAQLNDRLKASEDAIEALKEFHDTSTKKAVQDARQALLSELKRAKEDRDVDAEVRVTDELTKLNAAEVKADKEAKDDKASKTGGEDKSVVDYTQTDWWRAWAAENPWFGKDMRKTSLSQGIVRELLQNPETAHLRGKELLDKVSAEVDAALGTGQRRGAPDRVEGSRGGTPRSGDGRRSYNSLPEDAKAVCDRQATRMVGAGRAFKDVESWQKYYAKEFYRGEE